MNDKIIAVVSIPEYRANFLWPNTSGSVEDAGYEFANAKTEEGRLQWWKELLLRINNKTWAAKKVEVNNEL